MNAFNIQTNNINDSLTRTDIHRLLPALVDVKINEGCSKSGGRVTWKSKADLFIFVGLFSDYFRYFNWFNHCDIY